MAKARSVGTTGAAKVAAVQRTRKVPATSTENLTADEREQMIAEAAYFRAERRGFQGGDPVQDWIEAEAEVERTLSTGLH
jgi:hypothetical protein